MYRGMLNEGTSTITYNLAWTNIEKSRSFKVRNAIEFRWKESRNKQLKTRN